MNQRRRVRHELADTALLMLFSAGVSVSIALALGLVLSVTRWS